MPLDENQLQELYALRKSQLPDYRDVVSFERVEIRDAWIKYGYEKVYAALRAIGLNGWKMRMLSKILDGSVDPDPKPTWIENNKPKPLAHKPIVRTASSEPVGNAGDVDDKTLASLSPEISELVRKFTKKQ
jgi:hypothetical protein